MLSLPVLVDQTTREVEDDCHADPGRGCMDIDSGNHAKGRYYLTHDPGLKFEFKKSPLRILTYSRRELGTTLSDAVFNALSSSAVRHAMPSDS